MADGRRVNNTLGDSGAQSDFLHPAYCRKAGVPILPLDLLHPSQQVAIKSVNANGLIPQGFAIQRIQLPGIAAYDEDRILYVWSEEVAANHDPVEMPLVLGTATLLRAFAVATESELLALCEPLQAARAALMLAGLIPRGSTRETRCLLQRVKQAEGENFTPRPIIAHREQAVEAYTARVVYGVIRDPPKTLKTLMTVGVPNAFDGRRMSPMLTTLNTFYDPAESAKVPVVVENNTPVRLVVSAGECIGAVEAAIPPPEPDPTQAPPPSTDVKPKLTREERVEALNQRLDWTAIDAHPPDLSRRARELIYEFHDIFSLDPMELGCCKLAKHKIVLEDDAIFQERYRKIPEKDLQEVRELLDDMLRQGAIVPSESPYRSAVVLAKKKDGKIRFCIDFRRLNKRTRRDAFPLPQDRGDRQQTGSGQGLLDRRPQVGVLASRDGRGIPEVHGLHRGAHGVLRVCSDAIRSDQRPTDVSTGHHRCNVGSHRQQGLFG